MYIPLNIYSFELNYKILVLSTLILLNLLVSYGSVILDFVLFFVQIYSIWYMLFSFKQIENIN